MNQFLDLLATDFSLPVKIAVEPIADNGPPTATVICNGSVLYNGVLEKRNELATSVDLLDPIHISVEMSGKNYSAEKETAVLIKSIQIDGFELVPYWSHLAQYHNERHNTGPTSYLGFNGIWTLEIPEPFYRWRHRVTGKGWLLEPAT